MVNKKCHVFTPISIVNKMLDEVGYIDDLYGKIFRKFVWRWENLM